jgi:FecR protein
LTANRTTLTVRLAPLAALLALAAVACARADEPADPPGRVARINLTLGEVSMQPAGSESWVSDVLNRPMTNGDKLWADRESRAEMHIGSAAVRLGSETGVEILNIDDRTVQLKLSAGTLQVRVRALSAEQTFEIATPTASVAVLVPGDYRIVVGEENGPMQIAVAQGQVAVTDQGHEATVGTGQLADYAGGNVAEARISALPPGDAFDQWVADRDRREDRSEATQYVSREVTGYEDLDNHGTWQTAEDYGPVWVPAVSVGWAPYRYGHWGWIAPWGWTWIDDAPWGFAPFHYGRWVYYGNRWCWAPGPRRYAPVYAPALGGWVGGAHWSVGIGVGVGGPPVGWFPLGWNEVYVPSYQVSNNYVRTVNVTNTHVTNTTINNYITNNTTIVNSPNGRMTNGDGGLGGQKYANFAVPGAVTATSRAAFTSAQPVATHLATLPRGDLAAAPIGTGAPAIPPTARSLGRPAAAAPRVAPGLWSRPVVARTAPPPPPPSFEAQRHAVIANGGLPVPTGRSASSQVARPAGQATAATRADVIRVGLPAATRSGAPAGAHPAPASPAAPAGRPSAEFRPPTPPRTAASQPAPPPATASHPPSKPEPAAPQPGARPAPEYRPPAQPNAAPPQSPPQPATSYRPPTQPREATPQPQPRQTPDYRPPATAHEGATQASPRPAPEHHPPAPPRETTPQPAPHPAQENHPPAQHEAAPAPHEGRAPPPASHETHPAAPAAESAPRAQPHDKR